MGKGVGKLSNWYTQIRTGRSLIEFKNLRLGRAAYYAKQTNHKLPVPATFHVLPTRNIKLVGSRRVNSTLLTF
jgi:ribosomal protein L16/L10AE